MSELVTSRVGVLALQGGVEPHLAAFESLGLQPRAVRRAAHLEGLSHLVIPGGESTTLDHLLRLFGLREEILQRYRLGQLALFGTCAGAILLGCQPATDPTPLELLDARLERNAYGRQLDSFRRPIRVPLLEHELPGIFIRAPRFASIGRKAQVIGWDESEPVLVQARALLAASFHPELTTDASLHRYFLSSSFWVPGS